MLCKKTLIRLDAFLFVFFTGLSSYAQNHPDSVSKPVFKILDSIEVNAKLNTSYIKPISATGTTGK